jgi:hypothetical protein
MAFRIRYSDEAKANLDTLTSWLLNERQAGEQALRWLQAYAKR